MRMKDAITVALVLGRELRDATAEELAGVEASIGAIRGHMQEAHPTDFDPQAFDDAVELGRTGMWAGRVTKPA
jgi:hypothetical protein